MLWQTSAGSAAFTEPNMSLYNIFTILASLIRYPIVARFRNVTAPKKTLLPQWGSPV